MVILVTGGTGLIGPRLIQALSERGNDVIAVTRDPSSTAARQLAALPHVQVQSWPRPQLRDTLQGTDAIFNLAGESILAKRWTSAQRQVIRDSRVQTTQLLFDTLRALPPRPRVVVNASAVGYYGDRGSERLTEADPAGTDFLAQVCQEWEAATLPKPADTRTVRARIGVVFDRKGALEQMVRPFMMYGGGPIGNGSQWVSWIHLDDVIGLLLFALDTPTVSGALNVTSPEPLTNKDLSKLIGHAVHRPSWLPVPKFALKWAVGDVAEVLASGQRVLPDVALKAGFRFKYPQCDKALQAILG